jgi:hypothetical protein
VQLLLGIGLFSVSFAIENQVMQVFLSTPLLALCVALTLEVGKAAAIVWHRYLVMQTTDVYPLATRLASAVFRGGLVVLSLICSLIFLSGNLDRPYLDAVRSEELLALQRQLDAELARLDTQRNERLQALGQRHNREYNDTRDRYQGRIDQLQAELRKEMDNVIDGVFKGPRYLEFERLAENEKAKMASELTAMSSRQLQETNRLNEALKSELGAARQALIERTDAVRGQIINNDYLHDDRVHDPRIVAVLKVMESAVALDIDPQQFVFGFSIMLSLLIEVGILLAFDTVTVTMLPALRVQHETDVETEILKSRIAAASEQEGLKHESEIERVAKRADRTMRKAQSILNEFDHNAA